MATAGRNLETRGRGVQKNVSFMVSSLQPNKPLHYGCVTILRELKWLGPRYHIALRRRRDAGRVYGVAVEQTQRWRNLRDKCV